MKPLKLTLTAFGPYKYKEVIDFTELKQHRLFVVSGNTGAGKTSIFDGICFALYGEANGEDRNDVRMLRSHFAADELYTSVEFQFSLRGRTFRVFRQMAHIKSGNKSATGDQQELYEMIEGQESPLTDRFIVTQINDKIQEIIGLSKDQFSQIVMLPQGEFRKLLTSETENKEEIFRRLFKTHFYKDVAEYLNLKRIETQKQYEQHKQERQIYINNLKVAIPGREDSELTQVFAQEQYNTHQVLHALESELVYYQLQVEQNKEKLVHESALLQSKTQAFHQAQSINDRFKTLEEKKQQKATLDQQIPVMKEKETQFAQAEKARQIQIHEHYHLSSIKDTQARENALERAIEEAMQAEIAWKEAQQAYEQEQNKTEQREQSTRKLEKMHELLPKVRQMDENKQKVTELEKAMKILNNQIASIEQTLKDKQGQKTSLNKNMKQLELNVGTYIDKAEKLQAMYDQADAMISYMKLANEAKQKQQQADEHHKKFTLADKDYAQLEMRWIEGQASVLAQHLHIGQACPVCGSNEHPNKATMTEDVPTKEMLDQRRSEKSGLERIYHQSVSDMRTCMKQLDEKKKVVVDYGFNPDKAQLQLDELKNEGSKLKQEVEQIKRDRQSLEQHIQQLEQLEVALDEEGGRKDTLFAQQNAKQIDYSAEMARYEQSLANIPAEYRVLEQLQQRSTEMNQLKQHLELQWKQAQEQLQQADQRNTKAVAAHTSAEEQLKDAQGKQKKAGQSFFEALNEAMFQDVQDYEQAKLAEKQREELGREIEAFKTNKNSLNKQIEELIAELKDKQRFDLDSMQAELVELEQEVEKLRKTHQQINHDWQQGQKLQAEIEQVNEKAAFIEKQFQTVKDLYDTVRGENAAKISFERYLQIEFLEQIIEMANKRLQLLSNGQYYLVRSDRLEKRGRQSGLGLDVYDNYTGLLRDVRTLSGGEKFNASLCLALGMADVVQSYEGGVSIETMFIDEGFGSLDEESLNKAIDTLIELQLSGRMIGIISHVQELKQAIPATLEVKKTKEGYSQTKFVVS